MPVVPELENSNYLITQAIADYLAASPDYLLDGIVYPSAQKPEDDEDPNVRNIILFHGSSKVWNADKRRYDARVDMYEEDETGVYFTPSISSSHHDFTPGFNVLSRIGPQKHVLALNLGGIEIHKIKGVTYSTEPTPVYFYQREDGPTGNDNPEEF